MRGFLAIARTGLAAVALHPLRSAATVLCLVAILLPYVGGIAVARGLQGEADDAIAFGADLHVGGVRFGRPAPVPATWATRIGELPGVRSVTPRIVGEVALGKDGRAAVVLGMPAGRLPDGVTGLDGELFRPGASHELVIGSGLARALDLSVGSLLPPFYRNRKGERVSKVVGIFHADLPVWQHNLMFCSLETAAAIFDQQGLVTGCLVECAPAYREAVRGAIRKLPALRAPDAHGPVAPIVTSREDLRALLPESLRHMAGIFQLHFLLAFAVGIPVLMVTSGLGLSERRREAALLKATGWMTDELLLRGMVESVVLSVIAASLAVLLAWLWLGPLGGQGVGGVFLPGSDASPPFRLAPIPALLTFIVSFLVVATGTIYSTWRSATAAPALVLR